VVVSVVMVMPAMRAVVMVVMIEPGRGVVARTRVIALTDPGPAIPDRPTDQSDILDETVAVAGETRVHSAGKRLRASGE
jgi:hypothetical protein